MNIPWGSNEAHEFITNVGLITSDGPVGPNVMACEWTHHLSYKPGLIAISIRTRDATHENIATSKEFGVNIASSDQQILSSIAGNYTGYEINKIEVLQELGYKFYRGKSISAPMIEDSAANFECKLVQQLALGDHTTFVGEVVEVASRPNLQPIIYHTGKYFRLGEQITKPAQEELDRIRRSIENHRR